ncbi:hypothetical protein [Enterorhabdus sp. P55]|uniref:hypothetical protein n=1 Tax=Enterorhabdus sp. P55 TaxID=2304571 RepID=UPI00136D94F1|nr:hypothetical protein [Enterorhabdus sp. P55]NBI31769.1 hypothetical protein [Enterorhabdus sp. P55]
MDAQKPSKKPIILSILLSLLLIAATTSICLGMRQGQQPSTKPSSSPDNTAKSETEGSTAEGEELSPNLRYETRFFTLQLPPSWEGRWAVEESISTRESMIDVAGYHYNFTLDGAPQLSIACLIANINADYVIGWADGYAVLFFADENMPPMEEFYIKQHLQLTPEE